eukprot:TRINITY_DN43487_c0_g1_i1.p1 TRINITY_DN43487_c0_g1~~TRINITY_DN43487_c0_g1_i1.p1  ORF type:complete len:223 (-),score=37.08 TRINITY_DN43487_c0_g1_i1:125-751(-)
MGMSASTACMCCQEEVSGQIQGEMANTSASSHVKVVTPPDTSSIVVEAVQEAQHDSSEVVPPMISQKVVIPESSAVVVEDKLNAEEHNSAQKDKQGPVARTTDVKIMLDKQKKITGKTKPIIELIEGHWEWESQQDGIQAGDIKDGRIFWSSSLKRKASLIVPLPHGMIQYELNASGSTCVVRGFIDLATPIAYITWDDGTEWRRHRK